MKEFTEKHRPYVEFSEEEIAEFDREFIRRVFVRAQSLTARQSAYLHHAATDMETARGDVMKAAVVDRDAGKCLGLLVECAATVVRAARLARYRAGSEKDFGRSKIPREMQGPCKPGDRYYLPGIDGP